MDVEAREPVAMLNRRSTPRRRFIQSKGLDGADGSRHERLCMRTVGADEQQAIARDQPHETTEGSQDGVEIRVDVGVIELDVINDGDVGQILEELRRLVEERTVVFIAFDDEVASLADAVTRSLSRAGPFRLRQ